MAYGVLRDPDAALFVEYDGLMGHATRESKTKDRKNQALLDYGPPGSYVLRISHTQSRRLKDGILQIRVCPWRPRNASSLKSTLGEILILIVQGLGHVLSSDMERRFSRLANQSSVSLSARAQKFVHWAMASQNTTRKIVHLSEAQGFSQKDINLMEEHSSFSDASMERNLQPAMQWLSGIGLSNAQIVKTIARFPDFLRYSIDDKLNPTVQWLLKMGLSKSQVAQVVATAPQNLGMSIERNLQPTVQWLLNMGLSKVQVAKVIARRPQILGYSTAHNLRPKVRWLLDIGLSKGQVAKTICDVPQIFGLSIELNLKLTVQWLLDLGLSQDQVARVIAGFPSILSYSINQNLKPTVQWLLNVGLSQAQVAKAIAQKPPILGYSIEQNLKPKVQWLLDIGLSNDQVVKAISTFPPILGLSVENNLKPKQTLLEATFEASDAADMISRFPQMFGYSFQRLSSRLRVLSARNQTRQLIGAMSLTEDGFKKRFEHESN